jgi:FSR family fosmidomycin resistance protein-like MFS transporter
MQNPRKKQSASFQSTLFTLLTNLSVYGASHFLVDLICAGTMFSLLALNTNVAEVGLMIIIYNILAFGLQLPIGYFCDKLQTPKEIALVGILLAAIGGVIAFTFAWLGVILLGIGNALFHIGGGSISLNLTPKKATAPGVFVAPGALGLLVGTILGKANLFNPLIFFGIAIILFLGVIKTKSPKLNYTIEPLKKINWVELIILLLLLTVVFRSIIGFAIVFPWKTNLLLLLLLTIGVVLGKALGGILGDKFGWIKIGVGGLLVSIPFIFLGVQNPILGIIGLFLFNFTMPITLVAISNLLPGRVGVAFGLTCMALLVGALPFFSDLKKMFSDPFLIVFMIAVSAVILFIALKQSLLAARKEYLYKNKKS